MGSTKSLVSFDDFLQSADKSEFSDELANIVETINKFVTD